jgi:hypothetical protein
MIGTGKGAVREVTDFHLSRFACYLIAQNGDPRKAEIAAAREAGVQDRMFGIFHDAGYKGHQFEKGSARNGWPFFALLAGRSLRVFCGLEGLT